ncbi:GFA family protein [Salinibius halmophilus]|uniref:GFA family protein n=1 Tax=Salinibius halmophilus TaxID=1853216 RepID=UPI000E6734A3|nr:GFA family protein [Salinibius halmophilus]
MPYQGSCLCGTVTFVVKSPINKMYHCHCSLCQKQGGGCANAATIVPIDQFAWQSGEQNIKQWHKSTGFSSHFCSSCGSPVPNKVGDSLMWIPLGLVAEAAPELAAHLWLSAKPTWSIPAKAERNYADMPEDLGEFVRFLQS